MPRCYARRGEVRAGCAGSEHLWRRTTTAWSSEGMSKVLVLGGTSWLGGQIAHHAVMRGHDVTCLARGESGKAPSAATFVQADREDPSAYEKVLDQRWDMVIDVSRQPGQVRSAVDVLGGTTSHWTLVSTGSVYADQSGPLTEVSPLLEPLDGDVAEPETYGEGKVACEEAVRELPHHLVVRVGLIGGPGRPLRPARLLRVAVRAGRRRTGAGARCRQPADAGHRRARPGAVDRRGGRGRRDRHRARRRRAYDGRRAGAAVGGGR